MLEIVAIIYVVCSLLVLMDLKTKTFKQVKKEAMPIWVVAFASIILLALPKEAAGVVLGVLFVVMISLYFYR